MFARAGTKNVAIATASQVPVGVPTFVTYNQAVTASGGIWNDAQVESFKPLIAFMKGENTAIGIQLAHGGRKASSQTAMQGMGPLTEENLKAGAKLWQPVGPTAEPVAKTANAIE